MSIIPSKQKFWSRAVAGPLLGAAVILTAVQPANAGFVDFIIRSTPAINDLGGGVKEFVIAVGGQKAAQGSNDINGSTLGSITALSIVRHDNNTRYPAGSGPRFAPYLNFWITDGTNFAVVANEPTNGAFQPLYSGGYNLDFADLSNKVAKIFENADKTWLPNNGLNLTFADLAGFEIKAPSVADFATPWAGLGSGAPRELGTNVAYGVNWVFGDTLSNYVSDGIGYRVSGAQVAAAAVPEPGTLSLFGLGLLGMGAYARRRKTNR